MLRVPAKWFIRKLAERLTGTKIPDLNSGLRAFRREVSLPYLRLLPPGFSCVTTITVAFLANHHERVLRADRVFQARGPVEVQVCHATPTATSCRCCGWTMYFNPLKVLMPMALFLLGLGVVKAIYDVSAHPVKVAVDTVLIFVTGLIIASMALLADLIVRSRSD